MYWFANQIVIVGTYIKVPYTIACHGKLQKLNCTGINEHTSRLVEEY